MSKPFRDDKNYPISSAISEIISGMSALNMAPDPIDPEEKVTHRPVYLSECDAWAKHSMEHFRAALDRLRSLSEPKEMFMSLLMNAHKQELISKDALLNLYDKAYKIFR